MICSDCKEQSRLPILYENLKLQLCNNFKQYKQSTAKEMSSKLQWINDRAVQLDHVFHYLVQQNFLTKNNYLLFLM